MMRPHLLTAGFLCLLLCATSWASWASPKKEAVAAAMVYRLTKFVEWPAEALPNTDGSFLICFDQPTPIYEKLRVAHLKQRRGRTIELSLRVEGSCHVVVISKDKPPADFTNTLTIGTTKDFLEHGGHIFLRFKQGRLEFSVNRSAATNAGLTMSSELLSLASEVR